MGRLQPCSEVNRAVRSWRWTDGAGPGVAGGAAGCGGGRGRAVERRAWGAEQAGFATTFEFYAYPDRSRLRLSQLLVLPPYQGTGVGAALLEAVHTTASQRDAIDVVVTPLACAMQMPLLHPMCLRCRFLHRKFSSERGRASSVTHKRR